MPPRHPQHPSFFNMVMFKIIPLSKQNHITLCSGPWHIRSRWLTPHWEWARIAAHEHTEARNCPGTGTLIFFSENWNQAEFEFEFWFYCRLKACTKPLLLHWQEVTWSLEWAQAIFEHFGKFSAASCPTFVSKGARETGDASHHSTHSTVFHPGFYQNGILSLCLSDTILDET